MFQNLNIKRFFFASIAVFVFIFIFEWIFHGRMLMGLYEQTSSLWRPQQEMHNFFGFLTFAQIILAFVFSFIFTKGYQNKGIGEGVRFGVIVALLMSAPIFVAFAVQPIPSNLFVSWLVGNFFELIVAGVILSFIYQPALKAN